MIIGGEGMKKIAIKKNVNKLVFAGKRPCPAYKQECTAPST